MLNFRQLFLACAIGFAALIGSAVAASMAGVLGKSDRNDSLGASG